MAKKSHFPMWNVCAVTINNDSWAMIVAATAKGHNKGIKFMSKSEVDLLSADEASTSKSVKSDSEDEDDLPHAELKKKNSAKKSA